MNICEQKIRKRESEMHQFVGKDLKIKIIKGYQKEDTMLSDFMVWLHNTHTNPEIRAMIFHIENEGTFGGDYGKMQGAISKGKGKKKGVLDVCSCLYGIMNWFEFKLDGGKFSDEQLFFINHLVKYKGRVFIIRNFDFFKFVIEEVILKGIIIIEGGIFTTIEQVKKYLK